MFKEKSTKKRICVSDNAKDIATLDARHNDIIDRMQHNHIRIQELQEELKYLDEQMTDFDDQIYTMKVEYDYDSDKYNDIWTSNIACIERKKAAQQELDKLSSAQDEVNYYESTGYILFKYYNIIENNACTGSTPVTRTAPTPSKAAKNRKKANAAPVASVSILEAFQIGPENRGVRSEASTDDKSKLVDDYLTLIDSNYLKTPIAHDSITCAKCNTALVCLQQEGVMICRSCGYQEILLVEQNRPILRNTQKDVTSHASYKRINHFREWCSQVQGKESTDIPEDVFEQILHEIKKQKITDTRKISYSKMREILKKLNLNRYYEHCNFIINRINGVQPPHFPPELEEKLCSMFKEIQGPFLRHCPQMRSNFLSYSYVLYKFFQILGLTQYLKWFTLLKSKSKLYMQDQIFKAICGDLGWKFTPSL